MKISRVLLFACLTIGAVSLDSLVAQLPGVPKFPGLGRHKKDDAARRQKDDSARQQEEGSHSNAQGVPAPADSPLFDAFRKLQEQKVYHQRMSFTVNDPQMAEVMSQMGMKPVDVVTAGDTKTVSMHFKMPVMGQSEDFELRTVARNGRLAKKWFTPAKDRILAAGDASIAKQLAQAEAQYAKTIAQNLAGGPVGWVSAGVAAASAAASIAEAAKLKKQAHDFFEWSCMNGGGQASAARNEPPPLTDLRILGDQTLDGAAVTAYEFYVKDGGKFQGPMQVYVVKDTGLPMRLAMADPQGRGGMRMDYFGFNDSADIEMPSCMADRK